MQRQHSMPFGCELAEFGAQFRLWAPSANRVALKLTRGKRELAMSRRDGGWFELHVADARSGDLYQFRIDDTLDVPDPASRFNPKDVHGPSEIIDPLVFTWNDTQWRGRPWEEAVIYELHVGTFTPEGTFAAAEKKLDYLANLGITAIELMPVSDFPGARGWGYDGVLHFAPEAAYGRPEDLKRFVQAAHARGLMVLMDVVYNHFGPDGNYLWVYAKPFFTERHHTPWGAAINYDGDGRRVVRDFMIHNALYWINEFHMDGLRLDAVHAICDDSTPDILEELATTVRESIDPARRIHLILENDNNQAHYLRNPKGYEAQWNDDTHHALHILATGETDGYYADYADEPIRHLGRCLAQGFAFQGELSAFRHDTPRGEPSADLPPSAFINFIQTHDQVGNRALGERMHHLASPAALRAMISTILLAPSTPMLFMGEEFATPNPFLYFCDFSGDLARNVTEGRRREFARFRKFSEPSAREAIPDPNAVETFAHCALNWNCVSSPPHSEVLQLYRDLLRLRARHIVPLRREVPVSAQFDIEAPSVLRVEWRFASGTALRLIGNYSDSAHEGFSTGDAPLHEVNPAAHGVGAWNVRWFLRKEQGETT